MAFPWCFVRAWKQACNLLHILWLLHVLSLDQTAAAPPCPLCGAFPHSPLIFCIGHPYRSCLLDRWGLWEVRWAGGCLVLPDVLAALQGLCCRGEWDKELKVRSRLGFRGYAMASGSSGGRQPAHSSSVTSPSASNLPSGRTCFPGLPPLTELAACWHSRRDVHWRSAPSGLVGVSPGFFVVGCVLTKNSLQWLRINRGGFWGLERDKDINMSNTRAPLQTTKPWTGIFLCLYVDSRLLEETG